MGNKALLLTINSTLELTGGGIYSRTLLKGISSNFKEVFTIEKKIEHSNFDKDSVVHIALEKTLLADLVSRIFLCPSFYIFYIFYIIRFINVNKINHVFFHNSRLGLILLLVKLFTKDVKLFGMSDNQEAKLSLYQFRSSKKISRKLFRLLDFFLLFISEKLFFKFSNVCSFITNEDSLHSSAKVKYILPVCLPESKLVTSNNKDIDYLFTGSFLFEPNIEALIKFNSLAKDNPQSKFAAAGRGVTTLELELADNLSLYNSPTDNEMASIFLRSSAYVSLVEDGSGMKTKLAEALSFGLYVFASKHSAIGYEEIYDEKVIFVYKNLNDDFSKWSKTVPYFDGSLPELVFKKHFTYTKSRDVIKGMLDNE